MRETNRKLLSYALYPKVFEDYITSLEKDGSFRLMGSDIFFHGLAEGETCEIKLAEGKQIIVKLTSSSRDTDDEGFKTVIFEVNGNRTAVKIKDKSAAISANSSQIMYADEENPAEIGANIPGNIVKLLVKEGDEVSEKQPVAVVEAMKMETNILAPMKGTVDKIYVEEGQQVKAGELIARLS